MATYNKQQLSLLAAQTGFLRDNLEKVMRLVDVLKFVGQQDFLAGKLALKGGTAINLTVFDMPRLSVDIDLDYCNNCDREKMMDERKVIGTIIKDYMLTQGYELSKGTKTPHSLDSWVFAYRNAGGNRDNIKIEINYSMRCHLYSMELCNVNIPFLEKHQVLTLNMLELFGGKIKALVERSACRDLYDVYKMIEHGIFSEAVLPSLRKAVLFYMAIGSSSEPSVNINYDSIRDIQYRHIRASLVPVLRKHERFDFETAKTEVICYLETLLKFTASEEEFIQRFNRGEYRPDLLFEDETIVENVKNHPMAIWKTKRRQELL